MGDLVFRTEELTSEEIEKLYVPSNEDEQIISKLVSQTPVLLVGSRGVGKSFLFRVAENSLISSFENNRILPVFLTFRKATLVRTNNQDQFQTWMLSRFCSELIRALKKHGLSRLIPPYSTLLGNSNSIYEKPEIEELAEKFETSWKTPGEKLADNLVPNVDDFVNLVEDVCIQNNIKRIVFFVDEAAHVFYPAQQRAFFTLFRDLRSPYMKCNAAVYPGVTVYGDSFEVLHDAVFISLTRSVLDANYISTMKNMVLKQAVDSKLATALSQNGQYFSILAYAAGGNPRHLLKTVEMASTIRADAVNAAIRTYYRELIMAEHTQLSTKYPGYSSLIDWGRDFIESEVLSDLKRKNDENLVADKYTSAYFWIHRDAPEEVKESLRILEYSGIIVELSKGIRATRSELGTRYEVNFGCLLALEAVPSSTGVKLHRSLSIKRMSEFGARTKSFERLIGVLTNVVDNEALEMQLSKEISELDLTIWQQDNLRSIGVHTIGQLIDIDESNLTKIKYISHTKARRIKNAAVAAVCEYLLG